MLISNQVDRFNQSIVIVLLILVVNAQKVLARNDQIVPNTINQSNQNASMKNVPYVEYYIEHNVSQGDAKRSFFEVGIKLMDGAWFLISLKCVNSKLNFF